MSSSIELHTGTVLALSGPQATIHIETGVLMLPIDRAARSNAFAVLAEGMRRQVGISLADGRIVAVAAS